MRRLILVFVMCLLPLQWSWAAAASLCSHESGGSHFGHHEHRHDACASSAQDGDAPASAERTSSHPDCEVCHGIGAAFMSTPAKLVHVWADGGPSPRDAGYLPEPPVETLLRPPLSFVA